MRSSNKNYMAVASSHNDISTVTGSHDLVVGFATGLCAQLLKGAQT